MAADWLVLLLRIQIFPFRSGSAVVMAIRSFPTLSSTLLSLVVVSEIRVRFFFFSTSFHDGQKSGREGWATVLFCVCCSALAAVVCLTCGASSINRDAGP